MAKADTTDTRNPSILRQGLARRAFVTGLAAAVPTAALAQAGAAGPPAADAELVRLCGEVAALQGRIDEAIEASMITDKAYERIRPERPSEGSSTADVDAFKAADIAAQVESGFKAADDLVTKLIEDQNTVFAAMYEIKATTLEGFRAQARALVVNCWSGEIEEDVHADGSMINVMVSALTGIAITAKAVRS